MVIQACGIGYEYLISGCPSGSVLCNGRCLTVYTMRRQWEKAQEACDSEPNGRLASIKSAGELKVMKELMQAK